MATVEIPLASRPQRFSVTLDGVQYQMRLYWLDPAQCWALDIADRFSTPLVNGVPLVTGADLLRQYRYLGFGGHMIVVSQIKPPDTVPGWTDLGVTGHIFWVS